MAGPTVQPLISKPNCTNRSQRELWSPGKSVSHSHVRLAHWFFHKVAKNDVSLAGWSPPNTLTHIHHLLQMQVCTSISGVQSLKYHSTWYLGAANIDEWCGLSVITAEDRKIKVHVIILEQAHLGGDVWHKWFTDIALCTTTYKTPHLFVILTIGSKSKERAQALESPSMWTLHVWHNQCHRNSVNYFVNAPVPANVRYYQYWCLHCIVTLSNNDDNNNNLS